MPKGYRGNVEYIGFGKYKCPDCGRTKPRNDFISRRKGKEKVNYSRCNSCEYQRYQKDYYVRKRTEDPEFRRRKYDADPERKRSKERARRQQEIEERIATYGVSNEEIAQQSDLNPERIERNLAIGRRWTWDFITRMESALDSMPRLPVRQQDSPPSDPFMPPFGSLSEQPVEEGGEELAGGSEDFGSVQAGSSDRGKELLGI